MTSSVNIEVQRRIRSIEDFYEQGGQKMADNIVYLNTGSDYEIEELVDDVRALLQQPALRQSTKQKLRSLLQEIAREALKT